MFNDKILQHSGVVFLFGFERRNEESEFFEVELDKAVKQVDQSVYKIDMIMNENNDLRVTVFPGFYIFQDGKMIQEISLKKL